MIESFRCKETERIFHREYSRNLPTDIQRTAFVKLRMLHRSISIQDLRVAQTHPAGAAPAEPAAPPVDKKKRVKRIILVTGANGGLGQAIARTFLADGFDVLTYDARGHGKSCQQMPRQDWFCPCRPRRCGSRR